MKKMLITFGALIAVMSVGTGVYAASSSNNGTSTTESKTDAITYMKQVHPNLSDSQLQAMYNNCTTNGTGNGTGMMNGNAGNMMNGNSGMMNGNSGMMGNVAK